MATRKVQSFSIKKNLDCPVCFVGYNHTAKITTIPKTLLCGHTFCADCLENVLSNNHIQCPVCRQNHPFTGSIDDLPTNFILLSMLDSMCQHCRNEPRTEKCLPAHCNQELCYMCHNKHLQAFHSDYMRPFRALQAEIIQLEPSCSDHDGLKKMIDQQNKVIRQVNNTCDGLKNQIEMMKVNTIREIEAKVQQSSSSFLQWQKNIKKSLDEGKKIVDQSKMVCSMDNRDLTTRCEKLTKELAERRKQMPSFTACSFNAPLRDITALLPDHLNEIVSYSSVSPAVGSLDRSSVRSVVSIKDYKSYTGRVLYEGKRPWDISVLQSIGDIAFTDLTALHMFSDDFEDEDDLTCYDGEGSAAGGMVDSWGTVTSRDNKVFVSDQKGHKIHVCDCVGGHLYQIGSEGGGEGQLRGPGGLAMDEDDTLFVCDSDNHRICCFKRDGSFIRQFGTKGDREGDFRFKPWFIAASRHHNKVAVSDGLGNLYIFSHGGDHQRTITAHTAPYNMEARGVAIDAAGRVIVADCHGKQLLVLDARLQVVARMGSRVGSPGQLWWPCGVAITAEGEVLVCDWGNNCIQLFSNNHDDD